MTEKKLLCFAHRGARSQAPENTLAAIRIALDLGAHWIEIDVHKVENELVLIHDRWLQKTTNGIGLVSSQALDYVRSLDAGAGEQIPLLDEAVDLIAGKAGLNIEIKSPDCAQLLANKIDFYLNKKHWQAEQFLVSSFDQQQLAEFKTLRPDIAIGLLISGIPLDYAAAAEKLGAASIHLDIDFVSKALIDDAHQRGLNVYVYTANHQADIKYLISLGVDGLFSDFPERVLNNR